MSDTKDSKPQMAPRDQEGEAATDPGTQVAAGVESTNRGRSSVIMAAGTLVSRILGFVRQWLLVAAIGGYGIADAFNTANTLPNTLYNLLAGGILNAILVPTIVRTLSQNKGHEGTDRVNALLTLTAIILLGLTVLTVALAWPIVLLFGGGMHPQLFSLTVIFALWCLPQIFFYGVYALLGQVLNSLSSFGPYMWAPVVNNLVGIAGLGVFLFLYGTAPAHNFDVSAWDTSRIVLLAGSMTLGIALQALILVFPLQHLGFQLRANFHWRGLGFRRTGRVAAWAFAGLLANSVMTLIVTRIGSEANGVGQAANQFYPATSIYGYATMLYILPQSLVTISVSTAFFTAMAFHATQGDFAALSADYLQAVRLSSLFTIPLAGMLIVGALPLANFTASALPPDQARAMAVVLVTISLGIPAQTIFVTNTRVLYSLEDTRSQFLSTLPFPLLTGCLAVFAYLTLSPAWWLEVTVIGEPLAQFLAAWWGFRVLRRHGLDSKVLHQIAEHYWRCVAAVVLAGLPATVLFALPVPGAGWSIGATFTSGLGRCLVVGLIMVPLYILFTWIFGVHEVRRVAATKSREPRAKRRRR
ncbi:murein biosynthesis integral membrane protein MurJ [Mobiluncus mulieris]|uniref:murein biosynthesis integral membrane protein MurJ n=1 Tax=Mobiluncus mulieris TaxID=2052 RepID=UPI000E012ED2|nr:lipid II flippase MurJ [Mobiluncus mulieris]STY83757.1 Probable peptidoglycan biosynthesis protein MurJ [Mobiluncus mulieris]